MRRKKSSLYVTLLGRKSGYEIKSSDVGRDLGPDFGKVSPSDVGRMVWKRGYGVVMESPEQASTRKRKKAPNMRRRRKSNMFIARNLDMRSTGGPLILKGTPATIIKRRKTGEIWVNIHGFGHRNLMPSDLTSKKKRKNSPWLFQGHQEKNPGSLYEKIKALKIPFDSHRSDLYFLATPESRKIVKESGRHPYPFISPRDGKVWIEVPFAYDPFWRTPRKRRKNSPWLFRGHAAAPKGWGKGKRKRRKSKSRNRRSSPAQLAYRKLVKKYGVKGASRHWKKRKR